MAHLKDGQLAITEIPSGKTLRTFAVPGWHGLLPGWSPNGKQVAFGSHGFYIDAGGLLVSEAVGLWLMDMDSGRVTLIGEGPWTMPVWSPDGSKFSFLHRGLRKSSIWIVDAKELVNLKPEGR